MQLPHKFGRYVLTRKLATGGMAEIYRATYLGEGGFEKTVAVKRLLPAWSADRDFITMLIDEAKVLVRLQHKNIVPVFELGKEDESFFISMELVEGIDVGCLLHKMAKTVLPLKFSIYIISQTLEALAFAHHQKAPDGRLLNIVHRDVSPPNILLSWNGEVKVADFGIAKGAHRTYETTVTQVKGKYSYMSPEQASGRTVDHRTDIYAAGILFFELLTGERLYDAPNDLEVIELAKESMAPLERLSNINKELKEIILKALKREASQRYQSAEDFLAPLNQFALKHQMMTTSLEFGKFLRETFTDEIKTHENKPAREEGSKIIAPPISTKPFGKITSFRVRFGGRRMLISIGLMFLIAFLIFTTYRRHKTAALPASSAMAAPMAVKPQQGVPQNIKKEEPATINIQAKPWGYVTIPGYISNKETPVHSLKLKPGVHLIKIYYEPANQWVSENLEVKNGSTANCVAVFGDHPSFQCN